MITNGSGVLLATLCLNEQEWLPRLVEQHKDWPELAKWVFVEAADKTYVDVNPQRVSREGLSVDGTTEYLAQLAYSNPAKFVHVKHGVTSHKDPAQGKTPARNRYLEIADEVKPEWVFVLDADEFYTKFDQIEVLRLMRKLRHHQGFVFKQRHAFRPPSVAETWPLLHREVVGGYWSVHHARGWRWQAGMRYLTDHNRPQGFDDLKRLDNHPGMPQCVHVGFASALVNRAAKHRYYVARGEGRTDRRQMYVDCRRAFETWKDGDALPHGAAVQRWAGPVPECFGWGTEAVEHSLIEVDEIPGGRLAWRYGMGGTVELYDIRVDEKRRRQKIATTLIKRLMERVGGRTIYGFCRADNFPALTMYHNLGFILNRTPGFYTRGSEDAVMFSTALTKRGYKAAESPVNVEEDVLVCCREWDL